MMATLIAVAVLAVVLVALVVAGGGISETRKMLGAALSPWLALPLAGWVSSGAIDYDAAGQAILSTVAAVLAYALPNRSGEVV